MSELLLALSLFLFGAVLTGHNVDLIHITHKGGDSPPPPMKISVHIHAHAQ